MKNALVCGFPTDTWLYMILSLVFFVGLILLIISPEGLKKYNEKLNKEYGIKKRVIPPLESLYINVIDVVVVKYVRFVGLICAIAAYLILLWYRIAN